ncbi:MAG: 4Fe-4S dicluster domain-containing protein [Coriobacteriales bacterium]|nr:4Fe-4S dicluster domain-containing protein [Coriobacteriales bacterium]
MQNDVPIGSYWLKVLRIGPNPKYEGAINPDCEMYYLPMQCQHCENPFCVEVCPTAASQKMADGTVQVDKARCIGCQFCVMACPYGVRYLNEEEGVVEKCTLCEQKTEHGELPQCVINCGGHARFFGDLEKGIETFEAYEEPKTLGSGLSYDAMCSARVKFKDWVRPYTDADVYTVTDVGNKPSMRYVLRYAKWVG